MSRSVATGLGRSRPGCGHFARTRHSQSRRGGVDGTADEGAGLVAYLAGPQAGFVTGASLTIDGGFNA
ncbi:MAG TPA: SDR family oxidoreductase [Chthoniobacterales bacterium]